MKTDEDVRKFVEGLSLTYANRRLTLAEILRAAYMEGLYDGQTE